MNPENRSKNRYDQLGIEIDGNLDGVCIRRRTSISRYPAYRRGIKQSSSLQPDPNPFTGLLDTRAVYLGIHPNK